MTVTAAEPTQQARPDAASVTTPAQAREQELPPPELRPADPFARVQGLQQGLGNRAVLDRAAGCPALAACPTGGACHACPFRGSSEPSSARIGLQPKLVVGPPGDRFEQEADRVADQVVRNGSASPPAVEALPPARPPHAQRDCVGCGDEEERPVQRKPVTAEPPDLAAPERAIRPGAGQPLPAATRAYFEWRFGHGFGDVRLHTDSQAAASARAVRAHAYTVGRDIAFAAGQYAPETTEGRRLLAHELTHVVQQAGALGARPSWTLPLGWHQGQQVPRSQATRAEAVDTLVPPAVTPLDAPRIQRDDEPETAPEQEAEPAERPLTRAEEIERSRTSAGEITGTTHPPVITLYNFAIDSASLKERHRAALDEVAALLRRARSSNLRVLVLGHADASGEPRVNNPLSWRRARAVQRILGATGVQVGAAGVGEEQPADTNDTVAGRSRNRRVDIHFLPDRPPPPPPPPGREEPPPPGTEEPPPGREEPPPTVEPPGESAPWFCVEHPIICTALGLGAAGLAALAWFCITHPLACISTPPVVPPPGDRPPPKDPDEPRDPDEEPPEPHACVDSVNLPSGTLLAHGQGPILGSFYFLRRSFSMGITFREDPATGCRANKGEYLQQLRGFSERDDATGTMRREQVRLVGGDLHPTTYREDARDSNPVLPYGHRYWDDLMETLPRPNQDEDSFLPDRVDGPEYDGADEPGMSSNVPGEHIRFSFEFRGVPVNRHLGIRTPIGAWHHWIVRGDFTVPAPAPPTTTPTPTTPPTTPSTPTPTPTPTVPAPYAGPTIGPAPESTEPAGPFCFGGTIGCFTVELLQWRQRQHTLLTEDDIREAIRAEHRLLMEHRPRPFPDFNPLTAGERYHAWVAELRREARRRVLDFAGLSALIPTRYAD